MNTSITNRIIFQLINALPPYLFKARNKSGRPMYAVGSLINIAKLTNRNARRKFFRFCLSIHCEKKYIPNTEQHSIADSGIKCPPEINIHWNKSVNKCCPESSFFGDIFPYEQK